MSRNQIRRRPFLRQALDEMMALMAEQDRLREAILRAFPETVFRDRKRVRLGEAVINELLKEK